MNIAGLAIKKPVFVVMIVFSVITLGLLGFSSLPWDLMPNVELPSMTVSVIYPGASAEEMENLVAKPLEDSFMVLEGIDTVTTSCYESMAMVTTAFKMGDDIKFAEIKVREKVDLVKPKLPEDIQDPTIRRITLEDIPIMYMSLTGQRDSATLRDIMENDIKPHIETVPGVGSISIIGGRDREVKITVNKAMLLAKGISIGQIQNALNMRNMNFPVGVIEGVEKDISVRVVGQFKSTDEIANLTMTSTTGKIVRIKDVAKVQFGFADEDAKVRVDNKQAVMVMLYKQSGANSVKVADDVNYEVNRINKTLPQDIKLKIAGDTTTSIKRSVSGVLENIILGALLAIVIVFLFLGNFRSAIITAVALPNSIIGAFFLIWVSGFTINTITLLSLALAVGLLIDDSIVVRENIFRHIEEGMGPKEAAEKGTNEVALAVISTTLSVMAVFLPISFLTGMAGQVFRQFGLTVAFSLLISLLDAFTTAPMLSAYWYKKRDEGKKRTGFTKWLYNDMIGAWNRFYDGLTVYYKQLVGWAMENKSKVWLSVGVLLVVSLTSFGFVDKSFMNSNSGVFMVNIETYQGCPLEKTDSYLKELEQYIGTLDSIESYFVLAGTNGRSASSNQGMVFVSMKKLSERKHTEEQLKQMIRDYIDKNQLNKYFNYSIGSGMGGMSTSPILISITGPELGVLEEMSLKIKKVVMETPGTADVDMTLKPGKPEIVLHVDGIKSEKLGISAAEVGMMIRTLVQGSTVTTLKQGEKEYDINIRLDEKSRSSVDNLKNLTITNRMGKKIPLTAVCEFAYGSGSTEIRRENKQRIARISANAAKGYSAGMLNDRIKKKLNEEVKLPDGYSYVEGGMSKQFMDLTKEMVKAMVLAVLFMYMILASLYNSFTQPLIIMVAVLLALLGGPIALLVTGSPLDMFGYIGLLMVLGLAAKNGILLIDFANKKREQGLGIREAILEAAPVRLRPILMTTLAMIFGMLPIALSMGEGSKGREGMAIIVIGGLITSTLFTLVAVPIAYEWMENKKLARKKKKADVLKLKHK
ncbi:MAG: efflux RND transporter permease subunit [Spirochaetia bacterium]|nr:efflux RND transporter permease subunit [Spirochaetia bacterium]